MTGEEKDVPLTTNPSIHDDSSPAVARVSFKAPPFWKRNPKLYFAQIESQFTIAGITKDETKYHHVVAAIETDVIAQVSDIILNPPEELKYEALKERLIEQFADSETRRLKLLLQELQLGDDRPTQLLCKMRDLSSKVPEDLLKNLWLQRLPTAVQQILAVSTGDLDALAKMADKVLEVTDSSSIHLVEGPNGGCKDCHTLRRQTEELSKSVKDLQNTRTKTKWRRHSRSPARGRFSGSRSSSRRFDPSAGICWFHHKFGSTARNCKKPCNYNQEN
ncbi:hypothetical protein AVEN_90463-1 [Araneus ventricosus]|uniref:DUF7041 domain-containing protein n=1 Tax=Araneus ventricosus TaxID=182803 RepID=A0A4Y2MJN4_ARAVE|nr:hypothetical protein AVEN_229495-1 [Araneus ventricosus]GBN26883.1 hypothetical protein AVEN_90463-1 [Araneus ventricosus]